MLGARAATNLRVARLAGASGRRGVDVHAAVHVGAPLEAVWALWEDFENFPDFMSHVRRVTRSAEGRSHWEVTGPAGTVVKWDAELTTHIPQREIGWRTCPGAAVRHAGRVRFDPQGTGTRVSVNLSYNPVVGAVGHAVAVVLGANPKKQIADDLLLMKSLLERDNPAESTTVSRAARPVDIDNYSGDAADQRETIPEPDHEPMTENASPLDALDQARTVRPTARYIPSTIPPDAAPADALDQAREVVLDDEAEPHTAPT
ncbi:MAG TPA: SRPBCC family protein [Acidimicrobiales bacterium]|nr:SRPBCC family protein [Acidimicrobiales bacterium]